jgi:hypothetical protein
MVTLTGGNKVVYQMLRIKVHVALAGHLQQQELLKVL